MCLPHLPPTITIQYTTIQSTKWTKTHVTGCNEHISRKRSDVKKHLIFYGVDLDDVRLELIRFEEYCQDILEARIRSVLFEQLNITRDIPMDTVGFRINNIPYFRKVFSLFYKTSIDTYIVKVRL